VVREPGRGGDVVARTLSSPSYTDGVQELPVIEDSRGVDISQIRRQLRMPIPERVRSMVHTANVLLAVQQTARASLRRSPE
jgi:hypothetical protein